LITSDVSSLGDRLLLNNWRGAEAWHLLGLTLQYLQNKKYLEGLIVSLKLQGYNRELGTERVLSLACIFTKKLNLMKKHSYFLLQFQSILKEKENSQWKKIEQF
jgi:hypothetical protein